MILKIIFLNIDPAIQVSPPSQTVSYTIRLLWYSYSGEPIYTKVIDLTMIPLGINKEGKQMKDIYYF